MHILNITPEMWLQNESNYLESLSKDQNWNQVPLLNVNDLANMKDKRLVRFRGMVQDMFNPEYYYEQYEVIDESTKNRCVRSSKFTDTMLCKDNELLDHLSENNLTKERHTLVVISLPGLNQWVMDVEEEQDKIIPPSIETATSASPIKKRNLDEDEHMEVEETSQRTSKRQCTASTPSQPSVSRESILNFPLSNRPGKACHVKIYKDVDKVKLNDMIEAIGFLSVDPTLTDTAQNDCDSEMEIQTHNPPPSLIPRIHCVAWKSLEHNNPLVKQEFDCAKMQSLKQELILVLTQLFMGDALAAEYFIYHLISRVYLRADLLPLGKFTLNISHIPAEVPDYGQLLYKFVEMLVPKSHYLPMSLENMNMLSFTPKKDYECDRITSGLLQLSSNTHLVLDETKLTPGQLNQSGVKGVAALANAIKAQKNTYDFNYFQMEFECDIAFLILSEGKSLLPSDIHVLLKPEKDCLDTFPEIVEAGHHFLKRELLNDIRVYLTQARHGKYELPDSAQEMIQNEFVQMRQEKQITADDLHRLLVVARLICLSEGKPTLDAQCWTKARELEEERKSRLP